MKAKYAKLIRIGIMSKCHPYVTTTKPDPVFGYYYTTLDFKELRKYQRDWYLHSHEPLVQRARERTEYWIKERFI